MVTTHVLDTASGRPATGVRVRLERADGVVVGEGVTDLKVGEMSRVQWIGDIEDRKAS